MWLLACGKNHSLIEGEVWAILMLKVVAGFAPPVLIWQAPNFYKRIREPLVLCLRVLTMVRPTGCLLLTCSTALKCAGSLQHPGKKRLALSAAYYWPADVPGWEPICCHCLPADL